MHTLKELEKQQVGLRLPKYVIDDIDAFTSIYSVNRSDVITEAVISYIAQMKEKEFYDDFEKACQEVKDIQNGKKDIKEVQTLGGLIDELDNNTN